MSNVNPASRTNGPGWLPAMGVMILTCACFLPVLRADFVVWDDDVNITMNPLYRGLGPEYLAWMWTTYHLGHYQPLTWMSLGLDYTLWGMNPLGYHLTNMLLHTLNAGVFYVVAFRLLGAAGVRSRWGAAMAALFFAIHPLRAESVAWVTERRDVLSAFFFLVSLWAYLRMATEPRRRTAWLVGALIACALSLLSKAWAVTLPVVLLILDVYPLRRVGSERRRVVVEKLLFAVPAVVILILAGRAQWLTGATASIEKVSLAERVAIAGYGLFFYLWKTVIPTGLAAFYQIPQPLNPWEPRFIAAFVVLVVFGAVIVWRRSRWPWLVAAAGCYGVIVSPVLGLYQSGDQLAADRYSYLSCLSWAVLLGAGVVALSRGRAGRAAVPIVCTVVVGFLGVLTWRQTLVWRDTDSLWRQVIRVDPSCYIAYNNLGIHMTDHGDPKAGIDLFRESLRLRPDYDDAHNNLAVALAKKGDWAGAAEHHAAALRADPQSSPTHNGLGNALLHIGRREGAIAHFREAVRLDPAYADARYNLGSTLMQAGSRKEAEAILREGLKTNATHVYSLRLLGTLLLERNAWSEAEECYRRLAGLAPDFWQDRYHLGVGLLRQGRQGEAMQAFDEAVRLDTAGEGACRQIGVLMAGQGLYAEAVTVLRAGLARRSDDPDILNSLAWLLATCSQASIRNGEDAVRLAERADRITGSRNARVLDTLAAAYAEAGRFSEAVVTVERALTAFRSEERGTWHRTVEKRKTLYQQGRPYREPSTDE